MQTFLPYSSYELSANSLDNKRLGKQRVECIQILKALQNPSYGWQNHPATKMWHKCAQQLATYGIAVCREWKARGYNDTCLEKILQLVDEAVTNKLPHYLNSEPPSWLGREDVHYSHRCRLTAKDENFYKPKFPDADPSVLYVWPV